MQNISLIGWKLIAVFARKRYFFLYFFQFFVTFDTFLKSYKLGTATVRISVEFRVDYTKFHPERRSLALLYVVSKVDFFLGEAPLMDDVFHHFSYFFEVL